MAISAAISTQKAVNMAPICHGIPPVLDIRNVLAASSGDVAAADAGAGAAA
jgi:hypothetical protein